MTKKKAELLPEVEMSNVGELPDGWRYVKILDACEVNPPKPSKDFLPADALVTFVPMSAVDADMGAITNPELKLYLEVRNGFTSFRDRDVIMAKITPCMENGKAAIIHGTTNGIGFGSTEFHVMRSRGDILPEYLYHFIRQVFFRKEAENHFTGTVGQKRVPVDFIKHSIIPLPPLSEQQRIVALIEVLLMQINTVRVRLGRVPLIMKQFRHGVLAAAFSGSSTEEWREKILLSRSLKEKGEIDELPDCYNYLKDNLPENWQFHSISEITDSIKYGYTASASEEPIGPKMLRITDIQDSHVNWESVPFCEISEVNSKKYQLSTGDIVFARTGATTGKSYRIESCPRSVFASYLIRVRTKEEIDSNYLYLFFQSRFYWDQISDNTSGTAQPNCNASKLASLIVPIPPLAEQQEIVHRVKALFARADAVEREVAFATKRADALTQAVLSKAFRGELVQHESEKSEA